MLQPILEQFEPLERQLEALIGNPALGEQRFPETYRYGYLPSILLSLKQLQRGLSQPPIDMERCQLHAAGLGRLVMEYVEIIESPLGDELLKLASDAIRLTEGSSPE